MLPTWGKKMKNLFFFSLIFEVIFKNEDGETARRSRISQLISVDTYP